MSALLMVLMFGLFIAIDFILTQRRDARQRQVAPAIPVFEPVLAPVPAAEPVWVAGYQLPEEFQYHRGHTWARPLGLDTVVIGIDDFARRLIGTAKKVDLPTRGSWVGQGEKSFSVEVEGRKADFLAPVEGEVVEVNRELRQHPTLATDDPYGRGWLVKVRNADLARSLRNLLSGSLARRWMEDSRERLDFHLMALSGSVLQDGGEPVSDFARHLSKEDWTRMTREFLLT